MVVEKFGEIMENDFRSASKRFWQTVRQARKRRQFLAQAVFSKVVVAKKNDINPVTLTCNTNIHEAVTWKFERNEMIEDLDFGDNFRQVGQNLMVTEVDTPMLGEYSCWSGEQKISSTHLLLEAEDKKDLDSLFSCRSKSYGCTFSCEWTNSEYTAVRLGLGPECREAKKSCRWVGSRHRQLVGGFHFELSHSLSPYAEENTRLELTAEAIYNLYLLRMTKAFYLRDIIQPDSPLIVGCQEEGQDLKVTIDPPSTWSSPHSFFTLEHQIEYVYKDNGKSEYSTSDLIPKRISKLRVRSRDSLVLSAWSQWTPWKNVIPRKKQCKCKKPKYCCLDVLGKIHNCKRRRKKTNMKTK
ncbi:interleukin-12 subunit beta [Thalassophryne amazonica]|uniref:interleukin-12 subunit beta n=1 Tax=Thalassophryne amazonica TaxID=390379 RepID=UPI001470E623|nr:interleukin-12 subunit beta [Thalassophryne amazonica]